VFFFHTDDDITSSTTTKPIKVDHAMRCMDSMLSYGDHSAVIGGIYENVHSMEVRVYGCVCCACFFLEIGSVFVELFYNSARLEL